MLMQGRTMAMKILVFFNSVFFVGKCTGQSITYQASFIPREESYTKTLSWTFDRNAWNEVLFLWSTASNHGNEQTLMTVSNKRLSEIEFRSSLDAWSNKKGDFQYLRLSCSITNNGNFTSVCICTTYVKSTTSDQDAGSLNPKKDFGWTSQTVSRCTEVPRLSADVFKDFENVTVLEFDQVRFEEIDGNSFRHLSSLKLVRLWNVFIPVDEVPYGLLCGFSHPIVVQIYKAYFEQNTSGDALFRLLQCARGNTSSSVVDKTRLSLLKIENSSLTVLGRDIFSSVAKEDVISMSFPRNLINEIDNLTFFGFTGVTEIDISENKLTSLDPPIFWNLTSLKHLNLASNNLEVIDTAIFESLVSLQTLDLSGNSIFHMSGGFSVLPNLAFLDLTSNQLGVIEEITFTGCVQLEKLWLCHNHIVEIDKKAFEGTTHLQYLDLSWNNISNEELIQDLLQYGLTELNTLVLDHNNISSLLPYMFQQPSALSHIKSIFLSCNRISFIDKDAFLHQYSLERIDLGDNDLSSLHSDTFRNNRQLISVFINNNRLSFLPPHIFPDTIEELDLSCNLITQLPLFNEALPNLKSLNLYGNAINKINNQSFAQFPSLETLNMSMCGVSEIMGSSFLKNPEIITLDISQNNLSLDFSIDYFKDMLRITYLNMSHNQIKSAQNLFRFDIRRATVLDISHNPLVSFPNQPKYDETLVPNFIFSQRIILTNCSLVTVNKYALDTASLLGQLDLTSNQLTEFEPFELMDLIDDFQYQILLDDNPIKCSCRMSWLTDDQYSLHYIVSRCYRAITGEFVLFSSIPKNEFLCNVTDYCTVELPQCNCYAESTSSSPTYLDCSNKDIDVFPRNIHSSTKIIHFEGNSLTTFMRGMVYSNLTYVEKLFLDYNLIDDLGPYAFLPFPNIKFLSLNGNRITHLKFGAFAKLKKLTNLYLHNNLIKEMDSLVFDDLHLLNQLTLHSNSLELLEVDTMNALSSLAYLSNLTLDDNPWVCPCDNATFKYWIQQHSAIISSPFNLTCNGTAILTIPDEDLLCYDLTQTILQNQYHTGPLYAVGSIFCLLLLTLILVYRYRYIIQVIVYNKFELRRKQQESESCAYDAIALYDSSNLSVRKWIKDILIPRLEPKFKLYILDRDMLPGSVQCNEVVENIKRSRRTLVVLSGAEDIKEIAFGFDVAHHRVTH